MPYTYSMSNPISHMMAPNYNAYNHPNKKRALHPLFQPGPLDVICARGKTAYDHEGNCRFRALVNLHKESYATVSTCKYQKSKIVTEIVNTVRQASPHGGFVKLVNGVYYEVGDRAAKEKIGQTFRDLLHTKYTSSTKAKARARVERRTKEGKVDDSADKEEKRASHSQSVPEAVKSRPQNVDKDPSSSASVVSEHSHDSKRNQKNETRTAPEFIHVKIPAPSRALRAQSKMQPSLLETLRETIHSMDTPSPNSDGCSDDLEPLPLKKATKLNSAETERDFEPPMILPTPLTTAPIEFHDSELELHYAALDDDSMQLFCECMGISV